MGAVFGVGRVRGKRGRGVSGKAIVLSLPKRGEWVYAETVPNTPKAML